MDKEIRITDKMKITELLFNYNSHIDANYVKVMWVTIEPIKNGGIRYKDAYGLIGNNPNMQRLF